MEKEQIILEKDQQIAVLAEEKVALITENDSLKERIAWFERQVFGQKREKFIPADPGQLSLELGEQSQALEAPGTETITYERKKKKAKKPPTGRKPWPAHLPRVKVYLYPEGIDLDEYIQVGDDTTSELEQRPAVLFVREIIRPRLVRKTDHYDPQNEGSMVIQAPAPERPLPKISVGIRLLAQIVCDKFLDHLPLHRQMKRMEREKVKIAKSTLSGWIMAVCELLDPLFEANRREVLASNYLQADETRIQVLDPIRVLPKDNKKRKKPPSPGKTHRGYYWVYYAPLSGLALFDYHPGRGGEYPRETLEGFTGSLQTDGYQVYEAFDKHPDITLLGCLAHVRRKFFDAKDGKDSDNAQLALRFIRLLYFIEGRARELMAEAESIEQAIELRYQLRQQKAKPLIEKAEKWLTEQALDPRVLPQSGYGKAVKHALKRFKYLRRYLEDGAVEIDNNLVENSIRPIALGRRNYLFAGSEKSAQNAGNLYSLLTAAKAHGLNPVEYLFDVIESIPNQPINQIEDLLPNRWQPNPNLPDWLAWTPKE